jgi:hypothetical protein
MASVFLSYDHEDAALAAPIAAALENAGHLVWWDRQIHGGAQFNSEIERAVESANAVVVLWSPRSVQSAWVRDEAAEGRDQGKLVPIALDGTKPPMGFRQFQTIDLSGWNGRRAPPKMPELLHAIEKVTGSAAAGKPASIKTPAARTARFPKAWVAAAAMLVAAIAIGILVWNPFATRASATVAVLAGDSSGTSRDYARYLLSQLGQLQSAKPDSLQLVGANARNRASLVFEVAAATESQLARANLVLLDSKSGSLLWSRDFDRPSDKIGDLRQALAYTAAHVLQCATDAHDSARAKLKPEILMLYLRGCAGLAETQKPSELIDIFRQVVRAEPALEGAWNGLLVADTDAFIVGGREADAAARLRQDIAAARRLHPKLVQAYLAEAALLPPNAFQQRIDLANRAATLAPDQPGPLILRSEALFSVGQVYDSVDSARRAAQVDPISPRAREWYMTVLADAGRTGEALKELNAADRLWPGATSLSPARFRIHLRYGDPRVAMEMIGTGNIPAGWAEAQSFLDARLSPTAANGRKAIEDAQRIYAREPYVYPHLVQTLGEFGSVDELLAFLSRAPSNQAINVVSYMFQPMFRKFWRDPRSLTYAKRVGLLQYWSNSGKWPDFCLVRELPYDCKKEAAKLLA